MFSSIPRKFAPTVYMLFLSGMAGCSTMAKFDQYAYTQATSIKVDAIAIMGQATEPYQRHKADIIKIQTTIDKQCEYEKNRRKNTASEKMWTIVKDSTGHSFGGFIKRWEKENTLDSAFIKASQQLVGESFDQISQLESGKIKSVQTTNN